MATQQEEQRKEKIAETKRELQRRSLDQLAIYNPLNVPFQTVYDGFTHVIQAKSEGIFPRYIAEKMMREMTNHMINEDEKRAVEKENAKREAAGHQPLTPEEKNAYVSAHGLMTSNEELRLSYMRQIYKGVSKEHGMDIAPTPKQIDKRPTDVKILEQLDAELGTVLPTHEDVDLEVAEAKEDLMKELDE